MSQTQRNSRLFILLFMGMLSAFGPFVTDFYLPALPQLVNDFNTHYFTGTTHADIQHAGSSCGTDDYRSAQRQVRAAHPAAPIARALCCLYHCLSLRRRHTHLYRVPPYPGFCRSGWTGHLPLHRYRPLCRQCIGPHLLTHGGHQRSSAGRRSCIRGRHARMDRLARHLRHTPWLSASYSPSSALLRKRLSRKKIASKGGVLLDSFRNSFPCCATENLPKKYLLIQTFAMGVLFSYIAASPFIFSRTLSNLPPPIQHLLRSKCLCHHDRIERAHAPLCQCIDSPTRRLYNILCPRTRHGNRPHGQPLFYRSRRVTLYHDVPFSA